MEREVDWREEVFDLIFAHSTDALVGKSTEDMMRPVIDLAIQKFQCCLVHVWSVDPLREKLVLVAQGSSTPIQSEVIDVMDVATSFTGIAFETRQPQLHQKLDENHQRRFWNKAVAEELGVQSFLSLPIRNLGNPHQVTLVINFYTSFHLPHTLGTPGFAKECRHYANLLASSFESNLRERAFRMSSQVSQALGRTKRLTAETSCTAFAETVQQALKLDWVTVYLENWNGTAVVKQADVVGKQIEHPAETEVPQEVINVWKNRREFLSSDVAGEPKRLELVAGDVSRIASVILVPLHDVRGLCKGVVRCVNFQQTADLSWRYRLSYEDIAIVESMGRAIATPLDMLLESQIRDVSLRSLAHELRVPVVALRAVLERMEREYNKVPKEWFQFRFPYFTEAHTYTNVMQRLLRQLEITRIGPEHIPMVQQPTRLLAHIIQPSIRFMEPILKQRGMNRGQIRHFGFEDIPPITIDRGLFTQVVFNLLDNMVKYFPKTRPASEFKGKVTCIKRWDKIEIIFEDNGAGIIDLDKERIFEFGFRSAGAHLANVQGTGLGCWLAKEIVNRHNGRIWVESISPFQLVLELPHLHI